MLINLDSKFKDLRGGEYTRSFPRSEAEKAEPETLRNVLVSCLAMFAVKDKRDVFTVNRLGMMLGSGIAEHELSSDDVKFLEDVLYASALKEEGGKFSGVYQAPVIAQALEQIGISK